MTFSVNDNYLRNDLGLRDAMTRPDAMLLPVRCAAPM